LKLSAVLWFGECQILEVCPLVDLLTSEGSLDDSQVTTYSHKELTDLLDRLVVLLDQRIELIV